MDPVIAVCLVLLVVGVVGLLVARSNRAPPAPASDDSGLMLTPLPGAGAGTGARGSASGGAAAADLYPVTIFYGSQTGTAEGFAKQAANDAPRHGFRADVVDLEDFDATEFAAGNSADKPTAAVFMMATYGEGDPTDNALDFAKWVKDKDGVLPNALLNNVTFTVFGLGNRQYEHYNAMGKLVDTQMEALGATRGYKYGEGDDDGTLEEDYDAWLAELWPSMRSSLKLDAVAGGAGAGAAAAGTSFDPPALEWDVVVVGTPDAGAEAGLHAKAVADYEASGVHANMASRHYFTCKPVTVVDNRELRQAPGTQNSTKHVELDLAGSGLTYGTADDLAVLPENEPHLVESVARWLGYDLDEWFTLEPVNPGDTPKPLFPTPCTVRTALTRYCDLSGLPRKQLLGYLSSFAEKESDRGQLRRMASSEGKEEFHEWVVAAQRGLYEVFQSFPSVKPPLARFLQLVPRLAVRYYTIASSSVVHPSRVHLAVSIIRTNKPGSDRSRELVGVCSNYLASRCLPSESKVDQEPPAGATAAVHCEVRASNFKLPADAGLPVIMVGPGTGLAPMRAFLQERRALRGDGITVGDTVLFFGCRRRDEDYIYQDELASYVADGTLTALHTAFSREQAHKVYVQHQLRDNGADVWRMLKDAGGYLYVCGATKMGEDVKAAVIDVAKTHGGLDDAAAAQFVQQLRDDERYIQELWS